MKTAFSETVEFRLETCRHCLLQFYIPETAAVGPRWREPIWCPSCGKNVRRWSTEMERLKHENAGLRGALARAKKGAKRS